MFRFSLSISPLTFLILKSLMFWVTGLYLFGFVYFPSRFGVMDLLLPTEIVGMVFLSFVYFFWTGKTIKEIYYKLREKPNEKT